MKKATDFVEGEKKKSKKVRESKKKKKKTLPSKKNKDSIFFNMMSGYVKSYKQENE